MSYSEQCSNQFQLDVLSTFHVTETENGIVSRNRKGTVSNYRMLLNHRILGLWYIALIDKLGLNYVLMLNKHSLINK